MIFFFSHIKMEISINKKYHKFVRETATMNKTLITNLDELKLLMLWFNFALGLHCIALVLQICKVI